MKATDLMCGVCDCKTGEFEIDEDELMLHYSCGHETAGLILNLSFIGEETKESVN